MELSDAFCFEHWDLPLPGCHLLDFTDEQWVPLGCGGAMVSRCFEGAQCRTGQWRPSLSSAEIVLTSPTHCPMFRTCLCGFGIGTSAWEISVVPKHEAQTFVQCQLGRAACLILNPQLCRRWPGCFPGLPSMWVPISALALEDVRTHRRQAPQDQSL